MLWRESVFAQTGQLFVFVVAITCFHGEFSSAQSIEDALRRMPTRLAGKRIQIEETVTDNTSSAVLTQRHTVLINRDGTDRIYEMIGTQSAPSYPQGTSYEMRFCLRVTMTDGKFQMFKCRFENSPDDPHRKPGPGFVIADASRAQDQLDNFDWWFFDLPFGWIAHHPIDALFLENDDDAFQDVEVDGKKLVFKQVAIPNKGRFSIWFDPKSKYRPDRCRIDRTGAEDFVEGIDIRLGEEPRPQQIDYRFEYDSPSDDLFTKLVVDQSIDDGEFTTRREYRVLKIVDVGRFPTGIEFKAIRIPNGNRVWMHEFFSDRYEFHDGAIYKIADDGSLVPLVDER